MLYGVVAMKVGVLIPFCSSCCFVVCFVSASSLAGRFYSSANLFVLLVFVVVAVLASVLVHMAMVLAMTIALASVMA